MADTNKPIKNNEPNVIPDRTNAAASENNYGVVVVVNNETIKEAPNLEAFSKMGTGNGQNKPDPNNSPK